jgi:hypothetical protein
MATKMVSMQLSKKEAKEEAPCATPDDQPRYPYGTSLYLDEDSLKKLGMEEMPSVGTEFPLMAIAKVTGTSERETQDGSRKTLDLQITKMAIGSDDKPTGVAKKLYGKEPE